MRHAKAASKNSPKSLEFIDLKVLPRGNIRAISSDYEESKTGEDEYDPLESDSGEDNDTDSDGEGNIVPDSKVAIVAEMIKRLRQSKST